MDIYSEAKKIEESNKGHEHIEGQVGFYFVSSKVEMTLDDTKKLKGVLVDHKVIGREDDIFLIKEDDPVSDIKAVCKDYYINAGVTEAFVNLIKESDGYYKVDANGSYARDGYLWSSCRVICKGSEYVLLEFFICD